MRFAVYYYNTENGKLQYVCLSIFFAFSCRSAFKIKVYFKSLLCKRITQKYNRSNTENNTDPLLF